MAGKVAELLEICEGAGQDMCKALLEATGGDLVRAADLYFSGLNDDGGLGKDRDPVSLSAAGSRGGGGVQGSKKRSREEEVGAPSSLGGRIGAGSQKEAPQLKCVHARALRSPLPVCPKASRQPFPVHQKEVVVLDSDDEEGEDSKSVSKPADAGSGAGGAAQRSVAGAPTNVATLGWKLLTYNVWFNEEVALEARMRAIGDIIQQEEPDFVMLQEVTPNIEMLLRSHPFSDRYDWSTPPYMQYYTALLAL
eukprot:CAMPEP_0114121006 /NCGR_PEP_ID=MMETSP0043_2-20121206/6955_1 /TAXON_ID=464988 /ORGANISM="Hemiselmis andersenii, Strain CCMP644" /LENGTH=250 /DNA_ID=CAMNT_0001213673 /DNA_START=70 /DNA_END=819 /DNA_ORIENTATION=-